MAPEKKSGEEGRGGMRALSLINNSLGNTSAGSSVSSRANSQRIPGFPVIAPGSIDDTVAEKTKHPLLVEEFPEAQSFVLGGEIPSYFGTTRLVDELIGAGYVGDRYKHPASQVIYEIAGKVGGELEVRYFVDKEKKQLTANIQRKELKSNPDQLDISQRIEIKRKYHDEMGGVGEITLRNFGPDTIKLELKFRDLYMPNAEKPSPRVKAATPMANIELSSGELPPLIDFMLDAYQAMLGMIVKPEKLQALYRESPRKKRSLLGQKEIDYTKITPADLKTDLTEPYSAPLLPNNIRNQMKEFGMADSRIQPPKNTAEALYQKACAMWGNYSDIATSVAQIEGASSSSHKVLTYLNMLTGADSGLNLQREGMTSSEKTRAQETMQKYSRVRNGLVGELGMFTPEIYSQTNHPRVVLNYFLKLGHALYGLSQKVNESAKQVPGK